MARKECTNLYRPITLPSQNLFLESLNQGVMSGVVKRYLKCKLYRLISK